MKNDDFLEENYIREEMKVNIIFANIFGIIVLIISIIIFGLPFYFIWLREVGNIIIVNHDIGLQERLLNIAVFFAIFIPGIAIHELIHGVFFSISAKNKFKAVKFGILPAKKLFTPYCHCKEKLRVNQYRIAIVMPFLIMGIVPTIISIFLGNITLLLLGILFIVVGCGDILILTKTRMIEKDSWISDHPSEVGFFVYRLIKQ